MKFWELNTATELERETFSSLTKTGALRGEEINANWMSRLERICLDGTRYYVKTYQSRGRYLRKFLGRSRLRAEWENLLYFREIGIPTARLVAYGEQSYKYQGVIVTEEIAGARDLASLYQETDPVFGNRKWVADIIYRLAGSVRAMHAQGFIHNDLKWRNILADLETNPQVYVIDCPQGRQLFGPFLDRGIIKDLACLDKVAKLALTRTQRLRFFLAYKNKHCLDIKDRKEIARILRFFSFEE